MRVLRISLLSLIVCSLFGQPVPDPPEVAETLPLWMDGDSSTTAPTAPPVLGPILPAPNPEPTTASLLPLAPRFPMGHDSASCLRFPNPASTSVCRTRGVWRTNAARAIRSTGPSCTITSTPSPPCGDGATAMGSSPATSDIRWRARYSDSSSSRMIPATRLPSFGDGRRYWMSRLRALPFSAAMSTLWTLGPASEASIGNVQIHASPGFVDLVGTPIMGVGWMVGEDVIDRYLISWVENRTPIR